MPLPTPESRDLQTILTHQPLLSTSASMAGIMRIVMLSNPEKGFLLRSYGVLGKVQF
jgi:hypothetical protein